MTLPDPYKLDETEARDLLCRLQKILWVDDEGDPAFGDDARPAQPNPDKEWGSDTLSEIAAALQPLCPVALRAPVFETVFAVTVVSEGVPGQLDSRGLAELIIAQGASRAAGLPFESSVAVESVRVTTQRTLDQAEGLARLEKLYVDTSVTK